jgi:uncharacterized membrane protein (DUF2068 family)
MPDHAEPALPHHDAQLQVLRAVASVELSKGLVVLLAAFGILFLVHHDPWDVADALLRLLHISPDAHFAHKFLNWADTLTDAKLWTVAGVALAYSLIRFVEAYGLWNARRVGGVDGAYLGCAVPAL